MPLRPARALHEPLAGEWSVQEVLVHTRNVVVLVLGLRIRRLLYEHDPTAELRHRRSNHAPRRIGSAAQSLNTNEDLAHRPVML